MRKSIFYIIAIVLSVSIISACGGRGGGRGGESFSESSLDSSDGGISLESKDDDSSDIDGESDISDESDGYSDISQENSSESEEASSMPEISENEPAGALTKQYIKLFNLGKYRLQIKGLPQKVGDSIIYGDIDCYYKSGGVVIDKTQYGTTERTVIIGEDMYSILEDLNKVIKSNVGTFYKEQGLPKLGDLEHYLDGVDTISGVTYDYESFDDVEGRVVTFFYRDGVLRKIQSFVPPIGEYVEYDVTISSSYDSKVFELPSGYEVLDLS